MNYFQRKDSIDNDLLLINDDMDSKNLTDFLITPDQRDDMLAKHTY